MSAPSEPSRSSTSSPLWKATIEVEHGRWCGYWRRIARSLRWPISTTSVALAELALDLAHLVVRGLGLLGDVARRVGRRDVEDVLADQVEHVGDERVRRAHVAGGDQLDRAHAGVGHGQVVRDAAPPPGRGSRSGRARAGRPSSATSALHGSCTAVPVEDVLGPLGRRRDAADLVQRPALEPVHRLQRRRGPAARRARRSSRRRRRARHPRRWPRRPPVAGRGRRCRGSAAWPAASPTGLGSSLRSSWLPSVRWSGTGLVPQPVFKTGEPS